MRGRELTEPEQYAAVKLRLMQAFDEIPDMLPTGAVCGWMARGWWSCWISIGVD